MSNITKKELEALVEGELRLFFEKKNLLEQKKKIENELQKINEVHAGGDMDKDGPHSGQKKAEFKKKGSHIVEEEYEEEYVDDSVYGDDPMIDSESSMDADVELGFGDDAEVTLDDYGTNLSGVDRGGSEDYEETPNQTNPSKYDNSLDALGRAKVLMQSQDELERYDVESAIEDLEASAMTAMDGDVNKAKEIDAYLNKLRAKLDLGENYDDSGDMPEDMMPDWMKEGEVEEEVNIDNQMKEDLSKNMEEGEVEEISETISEMEEDMAAGAGNDFSESETVEEGEYVEDSEVVEESAMDKRRKNVLAEENIKRMKVLSGVHKRWDDE